MNAPGTKSKLLDALAKLELCLETPVVPGEMDRWTSAVEQAFANVQPLFFESVEKEHPQKLNQIAQDDPGLLHRVTQLKEQDQENLANLNQVRSQVRQLSDKAETVEPDEARLENRLESVINAGLAIIIEIRKQEAAIDTWMMEALDRDRGVVD